MKLDFSKEEKERFANSKELTRRQRKIFDLYYREGLTQPEIYAETGWSIKTIYNERQKILNVIKKALH